MNKPCVGHVIEFAYNKGSNPGAKRKIAVIKIDKENILGVVLDDSLKHGGNPQIKCYRIEDIDGDIFGPNIEITGYFTVINKDMNVLKKIAQSTLDKINNDGHKNISEYCDKLRSIATYIEKLTSDASGYDYHWCYKDTYFYVTSSRGKHAWTKIGEYQNTYVFLTEGTVGYFYGFKPDIEYDY